ncbi:MAG: hypothetical protein GF418_12290 [Chitinivibrionales bacterium]|nr:hypothetical protein [Chitinivibrionales bacterium]MBD3396398.1 hypothetical protein [Chitinivibrionales bacterium]
MTHIKPAACLFFLLVLTVPSRPDIVYLNVGDAFQDSVDAYPEGTHFVIRSGVHRMQEVDPKSYDIFAGEDGAVMNGARLLTDWVDEGSYWSHAGQTQEGAPVGNCRDDRPMCLYPEDMFMDDDFMVRVGSLGDLGAGRWYFDYDADKVYIADNPSGHTLEVSAAGHAFKGTAYGVTVRNLVIEKYGQAAQWPALLRTHQPEGEEEDSSRIDDGWIIMGNEIHHNHAVGIKVFGLRNYVIKDNYVHHNGHLGVSIVDGDNGLVEGNEISENVVDAVGIRVAEEGGTKFVRTKNLVLRSNWCHHNHGAGIWADIENINVIWEGNLVENNGSQGIFQEIGGSAEIFCNVSRMNGTQWSGWLYGGQILVSHSSDVEIHHNVLEISATGSDNSGGNGITMVYQPDDEGRLPLRPSRNYIHHNHITHKGTRGSTGLGAAWNDSVDPALIDQYFDPDSNTFDYNHYHVPDLSRGYIHWRYGDRWLGNLDRFQGIGQEANGTADTDIDTRQSFGQCEDALAAVPSAGEAGQKDIDPTAVAPEQVRTPTSAARPFTRYNAVSGLLSAWAGGMSSAFAVSVHDARGRQMQVRRGMGLNRVDIDLGRFGAGIYLVTVTTESARAARTVNVLR